MSGLLVKAKGRSIGAEMAACFALDFNTSPKSPFNASFNSPSTAHFPIDVQRP